MTQKSIKIFIAEIYSKASKKNYITNKADVYHIDDIWSLDILDLKSYLKSYGPENNEGYRCLLVVINNFSKFGGRTLLKNKNAQTIKNSFEINLTKSKSKPNLIKTDAGKVFYNSFVQYILNNNNIKHFSRKIDKGAVFAERFKETIRSLIEKPVFIKEERVIGLMYCPKQYNNQVHTSNKLTSLFEKERRICLPNFIRQKKESQIRISRKRSGQSNRFEEKVLRRRYNQLLI